MKYVWLLIFSCAVFNYASAINDSVVLKVIGRSIVEPEHFSLSQSDSQWLAKKATLRIGISDPDYPPLDITTHTKEFEGITADYSALLGQLLKVRVEIVSFPDRSTLIEALKRRDIDLIGSANAYEAVDPQLMLSAPYMLDQPTIITRAEDDVATDESLAGKKIAMLYHYLPLATVQDFYPQAQIVLYPSILNAIGAVAFGDADVYLGDTVTANYLINKSYLNTVQMTDFSRLEANNFSFALLRSNAQLKRVVDLALAAIPSSERIAIVQRWQAGGVSISGRNTIKFSVEEQEWLTRHGQLKVLFNEDYLPFSFVDENGQSRGLTVDVLNKISQRTGLRFETGRGSSVNQMIAELNAGKFDVVASLTQSPDREKLVNFSRPYLATPLVLVTHAKPDAPHNLEDLAGKKLAVVYGNVNLSLLAREHPHVQLVSANNLNEAFALVAQGKADATLSSLISARYIIARSYPSVLKIASTTGTKAGQVAFAVRKDAPELLSILNKSLLSISPEEMDEITNRWRRAVVVEDSYWTRHRETIIQGLVAAALLLLGIFVWITSLKREVSKRKLAERALNDKLEFERVLLNGTPHPIYARDRDGRLLLCNKAYLDTFGVSDSAPLKGTTVEQSLLFDPAEAVEYHQSFLEVMASGEPKFEDRLLSLPSGETLTIYHWMLPYRASDGTVKGLIGGWLDVSERQDLIQQLHAAKNDADNASRAKTTFLATMSHEIRTPLNAVIGMLEMATKTAEQGLFDRAAIDVASEAAQGLLDLIGDILDIARIETGQLSLNPRPANLRDLLMSIVRIFEGPAIQKSLQLVTHIDPAVDQLVLIDPMGFKQVLANLLSNAIKFTAQGSVNLSASATHHPTERTMSLEVKIQDSGIGISATDQQRLFRPFSQVKSAQQPSGSGSGLGLVISRTLVEMMGGTLELSSQERMGTLITIRIDLPLQDALHAEAPASHQQTPEVLPADCQLNILIVDDYLANRILLTRQLSYLGHHVSEACDGVEALKLWNEAPFDVIITDCNMPNMDGYELARNIRQQEQRRNEPGCLVLGFTANAVAEERQNCLDAGMDDCLFKPISLSTLKNRLLALYGEHADEFNDGELSVDQLHAHLMRLTVADETAMHALWSELERSTADNLLELQKLLDQCDRKGLAKLAHQIKGSALILQYETLSISCTNMEMACRDDVDTEALKLAGDAIASCMQSLLILLQEGKAPHTDQ
ncbi:Virulence sensor protein BvgS precursor [compost metagenome]